MSTAPKLQKNVVEKMSELSQVLADSVLLYQDATVHVSEPVLQSRLQEIAKQRQQQRMEIVGFLATNGQEVPEDPSVVGRLHDWWIKIRGAIQSESAVAMLEELERHEDRVKARYHAVLPEIAGNPMTDILNRQAKEVGETHDWVRDRRDAEKAKS